MQNKRKRPKIDSLAEVVNVIATSFEKFVASKRKSQEKSSGVEIHDVVSVVPRFTTDEVFKVVRKLLNGDVEEFSLLKALLYEKKKKKNGYLFILTMSYVRLLFRTWCRRIIKIIKL
ncbi:hypothetical protein PHJA_001433400 [Phtheirospermum japonicum]|uniref:Uncharacterized protein n=1 Tax=Phtheirospermum japonicum TaxID=374723 RepID=A0A830CEZ5_9LAMI|nr:hypothetical protein PHJA_001433400 [Phtheirospermum japonicum]